MIDYITKGHILFVLIAIFSSLGLASFVYQLSNSKNKFIIEVPKPKPKPKTEPIQNKQKFAYQKPPNNIKYKQLNNIPRKMQLQMNKQSYRPMDLVKPTFNQNSFQNNQYTNNMQRLPPQVKQNTGPVLKNKTSISQLF